MFSMILVFFLSTTPVAFHKPSLSVSWLALYMYVDENTLCICIIRPFNFMSIRKKD
jgi:hypothetical protein